ncbi:MAG: hypothetical protein AXA67_10460 [Methylothermaceae bacteria B42]|nr:MAG: hypothetical protein AXA67_10460 [Methylothermaceae bacteria B42]HHJ38895.1 DUF488 domain-containing protein [Methylothermaceae bacterium]
MIHIKRIYDFPASTDGRRYLVDRFWPRGVKKEALQLDAWLKEVAPSNELRKWFGHDPSRWETFKNRYFGELEEKPEAWQPLLRALKKGNITLLYSATDREHNNAVALKEFLENQLTPSASE